MTRLLSLRRVCLVCTVIVAGCSTTSVGWRRIDQATPIKSDELVWIWRPAESNKWHGVIVTPDSVSGIPYDMPLTCDDCRQRLPRTAVDSMQVAYVTHPIDSKPVGEVAGAVGLLLLLEIAVCTAAGATHC